jgi:hypothetical protein
LLFSIVYNSFKVGEFKNITTTLPKDFGEKKYYNISKPSKDYNNLS